MKELMTGDVRCRVCDTSADSVRSGDAVMAGNTGTMMDSKRSASKVKLSVSLLEPPSHGTVSIRDKWDDREKGARIGQEARKWS